MVPENFEFALNPGSLSRTKRKARLTTSEKKLTETERETAGYLSRRQSLEAWDVTLPALGFAARLFGFHALEL